MLSPVMLGYVVLGLLVGSNDVEAFPPAWQGRASLLVRRANEDVECKNIQETETDFDKIQRLSLDALQLRGTSSGLDCLQQLSKLCTRRIPYSFDTTPESKNSDTIVSKFPELLPPSVTQELFTKVEGMLQRGWLSTNPDSVDGLPSFHLNLVSNGVPICQPTEDRSPDDFDMEIQGILDLIHPFIYDKLLPHVNAQLGDSNNNNNIEVSDIFIRRYGQDVMDGKSRNGISAHYDVFSRVTSVMALDNVARDGRHGLYTTATQFSKDDEKNVQTSNHAALRRFFPLECGDAVVHTWDTLHGVNVPQGMDRTSLIVWFTEYSSSNGNDNTKEISPWLVNHPHLDTDSIAQFVLASAMESALPQSSTVSENGSPPIQSMHQHTETNNSHYDSAPEEMERVIDLYLSSAARGNTFAMTRVGSLLEEGLLNPASLERAQDVLTKLQDKQPSDNARIPEWVIAEHKNQKNNLSMRMSLARQFWWEATTRGNALAQVALADEVMATSFQERDARLVAATLFGLAAQQGDEHAVDSLSRLIQLEVDGGCITSRQDFEASPMVQIARVTTENVP